jgi:hypothetical protein
MERVAIGRVDVGDVLASTDGKRVPHHPDRTWQFLRSRWSAEVHQQSRLVAICGCVQVLGYQGGLTGGGGRHSWTLLGPGRVPCILMQSAYRQS